MEAEKRLIRYEDVFRYAFEGANGGNLEDEDFDAIVNAIESVPTVDAVVLPCKIGDKVYRIDKGNYHSNWKPFVQELTVTEISWKKEKYGDKDLGFAIIADGIRYRFTSIGKSVFLTRKEAEAKMDGDGNG